MKSLETLREWARRASGTFRADPSDSDIERELAFHLEMAEEELRARGHSAAEAARLARRRFGRVPRALQALHDQRGLPWLGRFSLDITLGVRRLRKSWGLTLIGGFAMTLAIAIAAGAFSFLRALSGGPVPLDEGDRVIAIETWSEAGTSQRTVPEDFERWRNTLRSVDDVGAFRTMRRALGIVDGTPSTDRQDIAGIVSVAEMSASGFRLARVPPFRGRPLVEADERVGAEPVVVIGYDAWRSQFSADPRIVGRRIRLGGTAHTVVGVMPEGFAFPINHQYWIPLRAERPDPPWNEGPKIFVFGRLAPGATLESAQAELATLGLEPRPAPSGATAETGRPYARVMPYAKAFIHIEEGWSPLFMLLFTLLLVPPCANIAILVYARTVVRQEEFAMRVALGASRGRIVVQLFIEMLVLSSAAAVAALSLVHLLLARAEIGLRYSPGGNPFWMDLGVSVGSALYVGALAMLAAVIAGVLPAIQATGRLMQSGLRTLGGGGAMRLGKTWSAMVVTQVALAVLILPLAAQLGWGLLRPSLIGPGFAAEEYMTARVQLFGPSSSEAEGGSAPQTPLTVRFAEIQAELVRRLEAEAAVSAVAVSQHVPGAEPSRRTIRLEPLADATTAGEGRFDPPDQLGVAANRVGRGFFEVFDVPLLAGRGFGAGDFEPGRDAVLVNRTFAQQIVNEQNGLLGRRIRDRYARGPDAERGYEIVGIVADFPANDETPRLYLPLTPGRTQPVALTFRVNPGTEGVAGRLWEIARSVDPSLVVDEVRPLDALYVRKWGESTFAAFGLAVVTLSVLLLSAAGMYALMAFTLNQRRREIGIRAALGAQPRRLLAAIYKRSAGQFAAGALAGLLAAHLLGAVIPIEELGGREVPGVMPLAALVMLGVCGLAAAGPARRALRVAPTDALREGG